MFIENLFVYNLLDTVIQEHGLFTTK